VTPVKQKTMVKYLLERAEQALTIRIDKITGMRHKTLVKY